MVSYTLKRRKRASATQLYQTCKAAGTCPSDVINKVEHTTIADQILKWASMGVYFGGLGIGTGSGSGGRTGYVPIPTGRTGTVPKVSAEPGVVSRPPVVIEPVAPTDPSIVSLIEESSIIESGAPITTIPSHGGFEVTSSGSDVPAILDVSPTTSVHVTTTTHLNPAFTDPAIVQPTPPLEAGGRIIISQSTITAHSAEDIPMDTFVVHSDPLTSTPIPGNASRPRLGLYSKALQQIEIVDPAFLSSPQRLITYDNPVFEDPDATLAFEQPTVHEAPDSNFMDIVTLHRPALTSRRGLVRFSRVGARGTMYTRSGIRIGGRVHFFKDISPIATQESIELQPLGHSTVNVPDATDLYDIYADDSILDVPHTNTNVSTLPNTTKIVNTAVPLATVPDIYTQAGPDITFPTVPLSVPYVPLSPSVTPSAVSIYGTDFYLHPSLLHFGKRRKRISYFFADNYVAA